jgi:hypothetical protein
MLAMLNVCMILEVEAIAVVSYHSLGSESLDLLDGLWRTLLEGDTVELFDVDVSIPFPS